MIYLDYTAHMPPSPEALEAFCDAESACVGNANAHHAAGEEAKRRMDAAREKTAELLSVFPDEIIFTSGASESSNTAIQGIVYAARHFGRHIVTTPLEHPSVSGCLTALQERGYEIDVLPIGRDGRIDPEALSAALRPDTVLVTLCAVDSELGVVQPVEEAARIIRRFPHCHLHVDGTQAAGKIPIDLSLADTAAFSAHKFGGITGSGILYKRRDVDMEPLIHGGVSTSVYRSGTPAVGLACSLAAALETALRDMAKNNADVSRLNRMLREEMTARGVRIHSPEDAVPHILNLGVEGVNGAAMRDQLNARGVCVSVKSACSVENTPSRAVYAVTKNRRQALEAFRLSLSHLTTAEELQEFIHIFDLVCRELNP
ncbi:MAG: cysteine desulfurase [Clostridia bacterium]|nr:cysteine desulfurase [Clostridia bacterium]